MPLIKMIYLSSDHQHRAVVERHEGGWSVKCWDIEPHPRVVRIDHYDILDSATTRAREWAGK